MCADTGRGSRHPAPPCALPAPSSWSPCARGCRAPTALGQSHAHSPPMALLAMAGLGQHSSTANPTAALGARCSPRSNVPAAWGLPCPLHAQNPTWVGAGHQPLPSQHCAAATDFGTTKETNGSSNSSVQTTSYHLPWMPRAHRTRLHTDTAPSGLGPKGHYTGQRGSRGSRVPWPMGQVGMPEPTRSTGASRGSSSMPTGVAPGSAGLCAPPAPHHQPLRSPLRTASH